MSYGKVTTVAEKKTTKKKLKSIHDIQGKGTKETEMIALGPCVLSASCRINKMTGQVETVYWLQSAEPEDSDKLHEYMEAIEAVNEEYGVTYAPKTGIARIPQQFAGRNGFSNEPFLKAMDAAIVDFVKEQTKKLGASTSTVAGTDVTQL